MPGANDIEENKIFREIVSGAGKGNDPKKNVDWKKYYASPLWDNIGPNAKNKKKKKGHNADK